MGGLQKTRDSAMGSLLTDESWIVGKSKSYFL